MALARSLAFLLPLATQAVSKRRAYSTSTATQLQAASRSACSVLARQTPFRGLLGWSAQRTAAAMTQAMACCLHSLLRATSTARTLTCSVESILRLRWRAGCDGESFVLRFNVAKSFAGVYAWRYWTRHSNSHARHGSAAGHELFHLQLCRRVGRFPQPHALRTVTDVSATRFCLNATQSNARRRQHWPTDTNARFLMRYD